MIKYCVIQNNIYICKVIKNKKDMKIYRSISKETGKVLLYSKVTTVINGKLTTVYLSKEDLITKTNNMFVDSFKIVEVKL